MSRLSIEKKRHELRCLVLNVDEPAFGRFCDTRSRATFHHERARRKLGLAGDHSFGGELFDRIGDCEAKGVDAKRLRGRRIVGERQRVHFIIADHCSPALEHPRGMR